ncbi:hypothetical protein [Salinibacillus xinjiangensis]|uniref:hypothetical protein n=1 Tax=Salinibacillus xinjiangensis TaxID=1229268 RepID=UPI00129B3DB5|nr:hypothetical protein [Salinibacillus xinjiangensis]
MKLRLTLMGLLLFGLFLAGCSSITLPGGENGEDVTIDFKDVEDGNLDITMENEQGEQESFNISSDGETANFSASDGNSTLDSQTGENLSLPDDFPSDFPLPDGAKIISIQTMTEDGKKAHSVTFQFQGDIEATFETYKSFAEEKGYTIASEMKMDGMYMLSAGDENGNGGFNVNLYEEESGLMGTTLVPVAQ